MALQFWGLRDSSTSMSPLGIAPIGPLCGSLDPIFLLSIPLVSAVCAALPGLPGALQHPFKSRWRKSCFYSSCIMHAYRISITRMPPRHTTCTLWSGSPSYTFAHLSHSWVAEGCGGGMQEAAPKCPRAVSPWRVGQAYILKSSCHPRVLGL